MDIGNIALLVLNLPLVGIWVQILRIPMGLLLSLVAVFVMVGTFANKNSAIDLYVMLALGALSYILRRANIDVTAIILAVVLGPIIENSFRQSLAMSSGDVGIFIERPGSAIFISIILLIALAPLGKRFLPRRRRSVVSSDKRGSSENE